jgi:hypothetical protein
MSPSYFPFAALRVGATPHRLVGRETDTDFDARNVYATAHRTPATRGKAVSLL